MLDFDLIPNQRFAIAFSGGGDSTALVHILRARNPLILIVDHGLRPGSGREAEQAATFAKSLGLETKVLSWKSQDVKSGLQEKARQARYELLGTACRRAGISALMTAHTRDDQAETLLMRYDRGTDWRGAAGMRDRAYAPIWPALANITLIRPLLQTSRQTLREYNQDQGLSWIEDPSNLDEKFTRIRARRALSENKDLAKSLRNTAREMKTGLVQEREYFQDLIDHYVKIDQFGLIRVYGELPSALWGKILRIASGTGGPIDPLKLKHLNHSLRQKDFNGQTLAGAYVTRDLWRLCVSRDPSVYKGRHNKPALPPLALGPDETLIWDGRFEITARQSGLSVMTGYDALDRTPEPDQLAISPYLPPSPFRDAHPIVLNHENQVMNGTEVVEVNCLGTTRLQRL